MSISGAESKEIYKETETSVQFYSEIFRKTSIDPLIICGTPFILVFYDLCLGNYTSDSWFFFYPMWYERCQYADTINPTILICFSIKIRRTPFPQKSFTACAIIVTFQTCNVLYGMQNLYCVVLLLIEPAMYLTTSLRVIKTSFVRMDQLSQRRSADDATFLLHLKDALILHGRINRYELASF